jgi:hypothetical protein
MANDTEKSDTGVATNDAYTGMLLVALLALIAGSVLLYMDYSQYGNAPLPKLQEYKPPPKDGNKPPDKGDEKPPQPPAPPVAPK